MEDSRPPEDRHTNDADERGTDRATRRTFLKGAAGAGATLVGTGLSGSAAAADQLVVDDYEEPSQWSSGQNDLGNWTGAGGWQTQDLSGGTLTLEYQDNAWYKTKVYQDVSGYDRIAIEARGATGSEAQDVELTLGNTTDTLANLSGQSLGDSFTTLTIPFSEVSFDATSQSTLTFNAPWGTSGTVELEELRFETSGGSSTPNPEPAISDLPDSVTTDEYVEPSPSAVPSTSSVEVLTWDFDDGTTTNEPFPTYRWDSTGTYQVTLTYEYSDGTTASTSQLVDVRSSGPEPSISGLPDGPTTELTHQFVAGADPQTSTVQVVTWDFDDGSTSKDPSVYHTYDDFGTYEVTLTYEYSDGSTDSTTRTLEINEPDPVVDASVTHEWVPEEDTYATTVTIENPEVMALDDAYSLSESLNDKVIVDATGFTKDDNEVVLREYHPAPSFTVKETDPSHLKRTENFQDGALFNPTLIDPSLNFTYFGSGDPDVTYQESVTDPGFLSKKYDVAYFGQADKYTTSTADGDLMVIVPDSVDPAAQPQDILDGLSDYADAYDVSDADGTTVGIALPNEVASDAAGEAGTEWFWTHKSDRINSVESTWVHEWVHIVDRIYAADSLDWFTEGYAEYMSYLAPLELDRVYDSSVFQGIEFDDFQRALEDGRYYNYPADLRNPSTWDDENAEYYYGALVLGNIDRRLRAEENASIHDVVEQLHGIDDPTHDDFVSTVADVGNWAIANDAEAWIKNDETPDTWTASEHESAFGYRV